MIHDLRDAVRSLARTPSLTLTVLATLALGIGSTGAMFGIADRLVLNPLPFADADRLVFLWRANNTAGASGIMTVSGREVAEWRSLRAFEAVEPFSVARVVLTGHGEPRNLTGRSISPGLLPTLKVTPAIGRPFDAKDAQPGAEPTVLLGHGLWRDLFASDPGIIGRTISLDDERHVVIGVMRAGFDLPIGGEHEFWLPHPPDGPAGARTQPQMFVLGKLARGMSAAEAQRELDATSAQLAREDGALAGWTGKILTVSEVIGERPQRIALLLFAATAVILIIGCFNVVQLLLARSVVRAPDFAVRRALGAGTVRLARQLGAEAAAIAVVSGAAGILLAAWLIRLIPSVRPDDLAEFARVAVDRRMIAFSIGAATLVSVIGVFMPWLSRNRTSPRALLQRAAGRGTAGKSTERLRSVLTGAQVAFSLVLVVGAALLIRNFTRLLNTDLGIAPDGVALVQTSFPSDRYRDGDARLLAIEEMMEALRALPSIESVEVASGVPPRMPVEFGQFDLVDRPLPENETAVFYGGGPAGPEYFRTLGIPLIEGRFFDRSDRGNGEAVTIISRQTARRYWRNSSAIGHRIKLNGATRTIVGIVEDVKANAVAGVIVPVQIYIPYAQSPAGRVTLIARTTPGSESRLAGDMKATLLRIDPKLVVGAHTSRDLIDQALASDRFTLLLLSSYASIALAMAALGIAGLVVFTVTQRTREIGIRIALGATPARVVRTVVQRSLIWCAAGMVTGAAAAFAITRALAGTFYEFRDIDLPALLAACVVLAVVAILASYLPARRAARVDPAIALRVE